MMRIQVPDTVYGAYIFFLIVVVTLSSVVFTRFVGSKPDGRKTVIGNIELIVYL